MNYLMSPSFWHYDRNIEINITDNRHLDFVYLLGKRYYSLYGQWNKNHLYICGLSQSCNFFQKWELPGTLLLQLLLWQTWPYAFLPHQWPWLTSWQSTGLLEWSLTSCAKLQELPWRWQFSSRHSPLQSSPLIVTDSLLLQTKDR